MPKERILIANEQFVMDAENDVILLRRIVQVDKYGISSYMLLANLWTTDWILTKFSPLNTGQIY